MTAHPVEMIEIDGSFAHQDRRDLERSRNQPAPDRQDQDVGRTQPVRIPSQRWRSCRAVHLEVSRLTGRNINNRPSDPCSGEGLSFGKGVSTCQVRSSRSETTAPDLPTASSPVRGRLPPPAWQRGGLRIPFPEAIRLVPLEVLKPIDPARRPADLEPIDPRGRAEAEVEPRVARRQVAATAETVRDLSRASGLENHAGAHAVPVRRVPSNAIVSQWPPAVRLWR